MTDDPYGTFELQSDLDLTGILQTPIPEFQGILYGHGHTITYSLVMQDAENVGLFGINNGTIRDLHLAVDLTVLGKDSRVGGLCGTNTGTVSNVRVEGTISADRCSYVGGLVGYWVKEGTYTLSNLFNHADVSGMDYVGGIAGCLLNESQTYNTETVTLESLENTGVITGTDYVAGLFGFLNASNRHDVTVIHAIDLHNSGDVEGKTYVGGLVGEGYSDSGQSYIKNASNSSNIEALAYTGCIGGRLVNIGLENCTNKGSTLQATGHISVSGELYAYVGGLAGQGYWAKNCTNTVDIDYKGEGAYVGGLFGYCPQGGSYTMSGLINNGNISGAKYVGGIAGSLKNESQSYTTETLTLESLENTGLITGTDYVAGLFGGLRVNNRHDVTEVQASDLNSRGDIRGRTYVAGLIGHGYSDSGRSQIKYFSSTGRVYGDPPTHELFAHLENIQLVP